MLKLLEEPVSTADTTPPPAAPAAPAMSATPAEPASPAASASPVSSSPALELKMQPSDAILSAVPVKGPVATGKGPDPLKDSELVARPKKKSFFRRLLGFTARTALVAALCGLAWAGGAYYSSGHSSPVGFLKSLLKPSPAAADVQPSAQHDELVSTVRQMADDIRALKASVASNAQGANQPTPTSQQASAQTATGAAIADLGGRLDRLQADLTTKLSQINQQLATIEQQHAPAPRGALAPRAALGPHTALASHGEPHRKRTEHLHDAFDPAESPGAPGAPRPLGSH